MKLLETLGVFMLIGIISLTFYGCKKEVVGSANADFSYKFTSYYQTISFSPALVYFKNESTNAVSYSWNFGDGESSEEESPSHIYKDAGVYSVLLVVKDSNGIESEKVKSISVNGNPSRVEFGFFILVNFPFKEIGSDVANVYFTILDEDSAVFFRSKEVYITKSRIEYGYGIGGDFTVEDMHKNYTVKWYGNNQFVGQAALPSKLPITGYYQNPTVTIFQNKLSEYLEYRIYREWF